jgi:hypothetical protein
MTRTPGIYGKKPPKRHPALHVSNYLTGVVPPHPAAADYLAALGGGWKMLGNGPDPENAANGVPAEGAGDCVPVTWANLRRLMTGALTNREVYPDLAQVVTAYKTQNPGFPSEDNGCDIQTFLEYLHKDGGPDGVKALAFFQVNPQDPEQCKAALAVFGHLWSGELVTSANEQEFSQSKPWDYVRNSPQEGGHSTLVGGYGTPGSGALGGDERFITWAEETSFTDRFWGTQVDELWVVLWPEHLGYREFMEGMDLTTLAADYKELTGKDFPIPLPTPPAPGPTPTPTPPPGMDAADTALAAVGDLWSEHHHVHSPANPDNADMQAAYKAWRTAKG